MRLYRESKIVENIEVKVMVLQNLSYEISRCGKVFQ